MARAARRQATSREVEAAIRDIRAYYHQGLQSLARHVGRGKYDDETIKKEAKRLRWNETKLHKARRFAHAETGYTRGDLQELFRQLRAHRPQFGTAHVGLLVTVPRGADRYELQALCIQNNWSFIELEREIQKRLPIRSKAAGGSTSAPIRATCWFSCAV